MMGLQTASAKPLIFGIDILPQSSPRGTLSFSLVILRGSQVVHRYERVSLGRLIRISRSMKPRFIATDNVYEIASNASQLLRIVSLFPPETQLCQVTGSPKEGMMPMHKIAASHGLSLTSKSTPLQTAEAGARLASMGIGYVIEPFKKRTTIAVTKGRVFGPGGMSQQRYRRRLCLAVLQVAHRIREGLRARGLDYDFTVRRSRWGYESCRFVVFSERNSLYGVVRTLRGPDVRVSVEPVLAGELRFKSLDQLFRTSMVSRSKPMLVGLDPGIVTGVAILSLDGEILDLHSGRGLDRAKIIERLANIGHPILICSDVNPPPDTVRKLAATLDCKVWFPETPLSTVDKREVTQRYLETKQAQIHADDTHQRDALAASLKAYMGLRAKFEEADNRIRESGLRISRDLVRVELVRGATIAEALEKATPIPPPVVKAVQESSGEDQLPNVRIRSLEDRLRSQREVIETLAGARDRLQEQVLSLQIQLRELETRLERERTSSDAELRQNREVDSLDQRLRNLEADFRNQGIENEVLKYKCERVKELVRGVMAKHVSIIRKIPSMTRQSVEQAAIELSIGRDDIVSLAEASTATLLGAQALTSRAIAAILVDSDLPQVVLDFLEGHGVAVLRAADAGVGEFEGIFFCDRVGLHDMILSSRKRIEAKEQNASREMMHDILEEYRGRRRAPT